MVVISPSPWLAADKLSAFYTTDPLLSNAPILVLRGDSPTSSTTSAVSGRIQCHVLTPAGLQSYPRLSISPGSPLYAAVNCLPREDQGDEICRAIAFAVFKYFSDLPEIAKDEWVQRSLSTNKPSSALKLFSESHAANIAKSMKKLEGAKDIIQNIELAFGDLSLSYIDVDVILPPGSSSQAGAHDKKVCQEDEDTDTHWGPYNALVELFGEVAFLPTSKIRRAPSRPTALNKSLTFTTAQRESLAREMQEFVQTERNYVEELRNLVEVVAREFRQKAQAKSQSSNSPDEGSLAKLFPKCLDEILVANSALHEDLQSWLSRNYSEQNKNDADEDATGSLSFAKCLLSHFPKLDTPYGEYIQAYEQFSHTLRNFMAQPDSSFSQRVQNVGEQRLMSMLIEPVQRLPRYTMLIDNMVKQLPDKHPALRIFLKAKDCVANTCARDAPSLHQPNQSLQLKTLVHGWPMQFRPGGRLIAAVDAVELQPPFDNQQDTCKQGAYIILLFSEHLVLVQKAGQDATNARRLLTELDKTHSAVQPSATEPLHGLRFNGWTALSHINSFEVAKGNLIRIHPSFLCWQQLKSKTVPSGDIMAKDARLRTFYMGNVYEQKARRWTLDFVKARVEGRFPEIERESKTWQARFSEANDTGLGLFAAIFEERTGHTTPNRKAPASIRIVVDPEKGSNKLSVGKDGIEALAVVTTAGDGFYQIEVETDTENRTRDLLTQAEFLPVLTKRLGNVLQMKSHVRNAASVAFLLQHHHAILQSLNLDAPKLQRTPSKSRLFRPPSPVKALSSLFGGNVKDVTHAKSPSVNASAFDDIVRIPAPSRSKTESEIRPKAETSAKVSVVTDWDGIGQDESVLLEATLHSYILALHARKGNIVGRVIGNRRAAEQASVNELYNMLLDNPSNHEAAANSSIDVLFAAWEQFLKDVWAEKMGDILDEDLLKEMQHKAELPGFDFEDYLTTILDNMSPQNRKALRAIIGLLADLLEGTSNDGDKGALTAAMTEILLCKQPQPFHFMPLIDRLVAEQDVLSRNSGANGKSTSNFNSIASSHLSKYGKTGSLSSKASSLSRRFGLGSLRRQNSKRQMGTSPGPESRGGTPGSGLDLHNGESGIFSSRPGSKDLKTADTSFDTSRPQSARSDKALAVPEFNHFRIKTPPRKKRRSSLSDLQALDSATGTPAWSTPRRRENGDGADFQGMRPSLAPSPLAIRSNTPQRFGSVRLANQRSEPPPNPTSPPPSMRTSRTTASDENKPPSHSNRSPVRNGHLNASARENSLRRSPSVLPMPPNVLTERVGSGNTPPRGATSTHKAAEESPTKQGSPTKRVVPPSSSSPTKRRIDNAPRLRERLQSHQASVQTTSSTLQSELDKIGEELARTATTSKTPQPNIAGINANLNTRLKALETKLPHMVSNLQHHSDKLEKDLQTSLEAHSNQVTDLKAQLKAKDTEVDALYARMNSELENIFNSVQNGNGVSEMRQRLKDTTAELAKYRQENARLARENASLKAGFGDV